MRKATITSMALACAAVLAPAAMADNMNRCLGESAGLGGYQFKNKCNVPINVFFRPGGIESVGGSGGWRAMTLRAGELKMVTSYSSPVACPTSYEGKEVTIDPKTRDCIVRDRR